MKSLIVWVVLLSGLVYGGAKAYLHNEVGNAMDMATMLMSPYADVEYSGVRSTMTGELTIENIHIKLHEYRDSIEIDRIGIDTPSFLYLVDMGDYMRMQGDGIPDSFGFLVEGLRLPTNADYYDDLYKLTAESRGVPNQAESYDAAASCTGKYGFSPDTLMALGYTEQVFSLAMTVRNNGGRFMLDVASDVDDMWEVAAELELAGDLMTELMKGRSYRPRLSNLAINYTDRSLNGRIRKHCKKLGLSDEEIVAAQLEAFKFYGKTNGIIFDEYVLGPYLDFLNGKDTISITANPNDPIAMSQIDLYKASDVPALLNLEAVAH